MAGAGKQRRGDTGGQADTTRHGQRPTERGGPVFRLRAGSHSTQAGFAPILDRMAASAGSSITLTPGGGFLLEKTGSATILVPETLSDEQRLMKQTADDFMRREVEPLTAQIDDKKPGLMRELLRKSGEVGLLGHDVPEEYGGLGGDKTSSSLIFEAASRQGSFAVSFGAHVGIGTMPLVLFGTVAQRQKYLPRL